MSDFYCDDCGEDLAAGHELDCPQVAPKPAPVQKIIDSLAEQLREAVTEIEAQHPSTRGHYGTYMGIFSRFADDIGQARVLAMALKKAGANEQGVDDALRVSF